jgi:hypothetical protein
MASAVRALGFPILMEAHVLVGVRGATMFDIIPEQDSITCIKLDHNGSSTVTLLLDDQLPTWLQGDEEGPWVTGGGLLGQLLGHDGCSRCKVQSRCVVDTMGRYEIV